MAVQTLNVIAIPAGSGGDGRLRVSLVTSPRLTEGTTLRDFPDFLNLTAALAQTAPTLILRFGASIVPAVVDRSSLRPELWSKIFSPDSPVAPFAFDDYRGNLVISYRTRNALAAIKNLYQITTTSAVAGLPSNRVLNTHLSGFRLGTEIQALDPIIRRLRVALFRQQQTGESRGAALDPDGTSVELIDATIVRSTTAEFLLYQRMPPAPNRPPLPSTAAEFAQLVDVHRAFTAIASYPALSRALGLVLDAVISADQVPIAGVSGLQPGLVSVETFAPAGDWQLAPRLVHPPVLYRWRPGSATASPLFVAADPDSAGLPTVAEGFLALDPARFQLVLLDLDGAMSKVSNLAEMLQHAAPVTRSGGLPALRSGGITLAADDRASALLAQIQRSGGLEDANLKKGHPVPPLAASDLVKGWRIDIWSSRDFQWRSLHQRHAQYRLGAAGDGVLELDEEGFTQLAVTSPAPDPTRDPQTDAPGLKPVDTDLYLTERLARWAGWSLSAPRPGKPLNRAADADRALDDDPSLGDPRTPFKMTTQFSPVPKSLPELRFGAFYRVRARVVDLAGNSPTPSTGELAPSFYSTFPTSLPPIPIGTPYLRWEPVPHPVLVVHKAPAGQRPIIHRLVIHSNNADPTLDGVVSSETDDRHIAPPRCSVELAEAHGMLDDAAGHLKGDAATFAMVVARGDGNFSTGPIGDPPVNVPIDPSDAPVLPYLPDPFARAAALRNLPGLPPGTEAQAGLGGLVTAPADPDPGAGPVLQVSFGSSWPDRRTFRLILAEGSGPPAWDPVTRLLTVFLPKAQTATIGLSSSLSEEDLAIMGVWSWQRQFLEASSFAAIARGGDDLAQTLERVTDATGRLTRLTLEGAQWSLTPFTPVSLVHAVQQPIGRPTFVMPPPFLEDLRDRGAALRPARDGNPFQPMSVWREPNSPDGLLIGALQCHYASTAKIDLRARWIDVTDEGQTGRTETQRSGPVETLSLAGAPFGELPASGTDARAVAVILTPDALLWFAPARFVPGSNPPAVLPPAAPVHRLGDTRFRRISYEAVATSRFQDDFPPGLDVTRTSEPLSVEVPSSSRPVAPRILYVVPTFGWRRHDGGSVRTSVRLGRGLRVYLDRPWYSSGDDELLAAVLWNGLDSPSDEDRETKFKLIFTQWGLDPVRQSGPLTSMPVTRDFPDATMLATGLALRESSRPVDVAAYAVTFDRDRQLWFADLTLDPGPAYTPFVRLALARFQPHSIAGVELSRVVAADFAQIAPDRSAVLINDPIAPTVFTLVISGLAPTPTVVAPWRPTITVTLEQRRHDFSSDLAWEPAPSAVASVFEIAPPPNAPSTLWAGFVLLAAPPQSGQLRIVIREYEYFEIDPEAPFFFGGLRFDRATLTPSAESLVRSAQTRAAQAGARLLLSVIADSAIERLQSLVFGPRAAGRLVYAEIIPLEPALPADDPTIGGVGSSPPGPSDDPPIWPPFGGPAPPNAPDWTAQPFLQPATDPTSVDGVVKLAQAMLNAAGAAVPALVIDGNFGPLTEAAVHVFRARVGLPDAATIDTPAWIALALTAPFPQLEPGLGTPAMTGPPIALVQRLLNLASAGSLAPENGVYSPETANAVSSFQTGQGLAATGIVDLVTWLAVAKLTDIAEPSGAERISLGYDRARALGGGGAFELLSRTPVDAAVPPSDSLTEDTSGRAGFWIEIQDANARPLYRQRLGIQLNTPFEVPPDEAGNPIGRPGSPPAVATVHFIIPVLPAGRLLAVFGALEDPGAAAALLASFILT